jgi:small subunit ribosomal protein S13
LIDESKTKDDKPEKINDKKESPNIESNKTNDKNKSEEKSKSETTKKEDTQEKQYNESKIKIDNKESVNKEQKEKIEKQKKPEKPDDFKYIVRIANTDIDGDKTLVRGLTSIKGIGMHMSSLIVEITGIDRNMKIGNITDEQIEFINKTLIDIPKIAPSWMMNHRKDYETGEDIHLVGPDIDMKLRDEINIMKKIRSYRGIRHEMGLRVRGQRTRANNRYGLALGVSKKKVK